MELMKPEILLYVTGVYAIMSELIGMIPWMESNSVIQLVMNIGKMFLPKK